MEAGNGVAEPINRRTLLKRGALGVAGLALVAAPGTALGAGTRHRGRKTVYRLHPRSRGCSKRTNRRRKKGVRKGCACRACYSHAANNLFPTPRAADGCRAHLGCDCRIVKAGKVSRRLYAAMFGSTNPKRLRRYKIDRRSNRWKRIRRALSSNDRSLAANLGFD